MSNISEEAKELLREAAKVAPLPIENIYERRAISLKFALEALDKFFGKYTEDDFKGTAEVILSVAKKFEEYITNG